MGGEFWPAIVYGFEVKDTYVKLRGYKDVYIGARSKYSHPVYYCLHIDKDIKIVEIESIINELSKTQKDRIAEFDLFAKKYGYNPSWQMINLGDFEVDMASDSKETVIERLCELKNEFLEKGEQLYDECGCFTRDAIDGIEIILLEECMGFMVEEAIKTADIDSIIKIVNDYYNTP